MKYEPRPVYLFRSTGKNPGRGTVVCAAPSDLVVAVFGGGGHRDQDGLQRAFGGSAFYVQDGSDACFMAVWGARNASRFCISLKRQAVIAIIRTPPPARLAWWTTAVRRPQPADIVASAQVVPGRSVPHSSDET